MTAAVPPPADDQATRADHTPACRWPHDNDAPDHCVRDCVIECQCDGEPWPCSTTLALDELADLRAQVAAVRARHTRDARMGVDDARCMSCQEEAWPCVTIQILDGQEVNRA